MQPPPRLFALLLIPLLLALFTSPWVVIVDAFVSLPSSSCSPSSSCLPLYARPILSSAERLTLNEPVLREIATKLDEAGLGKTHLVQDRSLGPGLHNQHYRFDTSDAGPVFVKINHRFGFIQNFQSEFESLRVLAATDTLRVPRPYMSGLLQDGHSFLAMEYMEPVPFGPSIKSVATDLGDSLARLHMAPLPFMGEHYGFQNNNYLGMTEQANEWGEDFCSFFIHKRLAPQLRIAGQKGKGGGKELEGVFGGRNVERLLFKVEKILEPVRHVRPSLLHGDLWQGNSGATKMGFGREGGKERKAFAHDPACWYGHAEFDLALSGMFGGFLPEFYQAYHALLPPQDGFEERQEVYRLYHYIHHMNNFGAGWGTAGSVADPKGYYERCLALMKSINSR